MSEFIGSRVTIPGESRGYGILRYVGPIEGKSGSFGGIELQGPVAASRGKNSGTVDGVQYFEVAQPMTGLFLPWERLRAVNSKLPILDDSLSRVSSIGSRASEILHTPSPPSRDGLKMGGIIRANSLSGVRNNGRESPYLGSLTINVSKRAQGSREFKPSHSAKSSLTGLRIDLSELFERTRQQQLSTELAVLRNELTTAKLALDASTKEIQEKNKILLELQNTVDELNPILGDYENSLAERDRKLKKQKQEYDRAREEWRQSLDLMLSAQQQAESLYEQQIEDLKEELSTLATRGEQSLESSTLNTELQSKVDELLAENSRLKQQIELIPQAVDNADDLELVEQLKKKIDRLTQDVSSIEIVLHDSQQRNKAKDFRITELEIELEELKEENINQLLKGVDSLSVDDWKAQEAQLKQRITELEEQITQQANKNNEPLSEPSGDKHSDLLDKISELEADLKSNKDLLEIESKKIKDLESDIKDALERETELQKQVKNTDNNTLVEDLLKTIEDLKHEVTMRPSFEELTELQNSLDEVERLHRNEIYLREEELTTLRDENKQLIAEKNTLAKKIEELASEKLLVTPNHYSPIKSGASTGSASLPDPDVWAKSDSLPIYTPLNPSDPSSGRNDWCGLCERNGHNSLNCPYENDVF